MIFRNVNVSIYDGGITAFTSDTDEEVVKLYGACDFNDVTLKIEGKTLLLVKDGTPILQMCIYQNNEEEE